ncbi:MAG TPA: methionine--tRNA ligase [Candidatus Ratteibacteria bacterium]|nr:methionine--tRNA ligase [bacterium]HPC29560.1 methionine--tRNA ligase [bacterium]HRS06173.1 methionine--tRNA ligase [Candidatus Ratteibacteria bacterium]HRV03680.1 methionine--tRNA ligase [Candidatus Ratteibacteria bacterium]
MKFYITTPIYYINAEPHIGHCYTTIAADCLARYHRIKGRDVFFLTGTDEHGDKIVQAASKKGITVEQFTDNMSGIFRSMWKKLNISYDRFIRTTEKEHEQIVQNVFKILMDKGDIYPGEYSGYYCVPCEFFIPKTKIEQSSPVCPDCGRPVQVLTENSYFFRLSKYEKRLLEYFSKNPEMIQPPFRIDEVKNFISQGLADLSITRQTSSWGIQSPTPEKYSVYVWFDALLNYLTGVGFKDGKPGRYWPPDVQLIGKDILRFHTIIWPAILMALNLPLPGKIFAHGWWTVESEKISKSKGNIVDPVYLMERYGTDGFRYFLLREVTFGLDGEYSEEKFIKRYNSDLANDLGNLVNRTINLVEKLFGGVFPESNISTDMERLIDNVIAEVERSMLNISFTDALDNIWKIINELNKLLDREKPWNAPLDSARHTISQCISGISIISVLIYPFIPETSKTIWNILNIKHKDDKILLSNDLLKIPSGTKSGKREILFMRIKT